ncbi:MAG: DUF805 domain-containing protein [Cyanobacteria bacterium]|nr:DUF805 domain-containing protein [Cyanobacteria bacterium bin.51]
MLDAYISAWQRAFDYSGRSNRGAYWWFFLANLIVAFALALLAQVVSQLAALSNLYAIATIVLLVLPSIPG